MGGQNRRSPLIGAGWGVLLAAVTLTGCSGAVDGKIVRAHGSSDSATLSLTVSACELKYNVDVAQDSEQVRVRVTGHRSGNGSPDCAMGCSFYCVTRSARARSSTRRPVRRSRWTRPCPCRNSAGSRLTQVDGRSWASANAQRQRSQVAHCSPSRPSPSLDKWARGCRRPRLS
ncbi:exported hypothetical protein [Nostocoides jenkinsii Ben 74]|uniref:Lipoprotein n=1 Tax=Nostocoides jenkinsii Ben 74 TaxID=1193518 RepID=A0A077MA27_9MICO|nr:exported hypothetical protein [Tetrasphaera jenkinsii Ben 74]